jgi:hypothetical protein
MPLGFLFIFIFLIFSGTANGNSDLIGVFSNKEDGFQVLSLFVHKGGNGFLNDGVGGSIGKWTFNRSSSTLSFKFHDLSMNVERVVQFLYDQENRTYTIILDKTGVNSDPGNTLHHVSDTIPRELIQAFRRHPAELRRHRREMALHEKMLRDRERRLAREQPEFDRLMSAIIENPTTLLAKEFYQRGASAATRALSTVMNDHEFHIPEAVLIEIIKLTSPNRIPSGLFARPELSAETIELFYPSALEQAAKVCYSHLVQLVGNPNTPNHIIEEIALTRTPGSGAGSTAARYKIEANAKELLWSDATIDREVIEHLFALGIEFQQNAGFSSSSTILIELARSSQTPPDILLKLTKTDAFTVHRALLLNPNTPSVVVNELSKSEFRNIREGVAQDPRTAPETLAALSADTEFRVAMFVARNPATPAAALLELQGHENIYVKRSLARNPNITIDIVEKLMADDDPTVQVAARGALRKLQRETQRRALLPD